MTVTAAPRLEERYRQLESGTTALGLNLAPEALARLLQHLELLTKWNRVHNLTAIRDAAKSTSVHLLDSLSIVPHLRGRRLLDVGSGAGFPGIPIAVARPDIEIDLLDSNQKKCAFLRQTIAELGLTNARVACERAESWRPARGFDCIVSRALGEIAEIIEWVGHLLAPGGVIAAMKGVYPLEEINRMPAGFRVSDVQLLTVPGLDARRHLVLIERA
ncbi:MAG TPA: 16S rRNA (guanine(527)-N(7))-methyltransferase RsmG [Burkholderiales bacterium]|nr:16S rRNA (guanine(527)-N(7))-methyltransferase RsmG [Burkholderiales bacterium]